MYIWPSHIAKSKVVSLHQWAPNLSTADLTSVRWLKYFFIGFVALVASSLIRPRHQSRHCWLSFRVYIKCRANENDNAEDPANDKIMKKTLQRAGYLSWPPSNIWPRHRPQHEEAVRSPCVICLAAEQTKTQTRKHNLKNKVVLESFKKLSTPPFFEHLGCKFFQLTFKMRVNVCCDKKKKRVVRWKL